MPFLAEEHIEIPTTDLLSWMFDKQTYDAEKPVNTNVSTCEDLRAEHCRYTWTRQILNDQYPRVKQEALAESYAPVSSQLG